MSTATRAALGAHCACRDAEKSRWTTLGLRQGLEVPTCPMA